MCILAARFPAKSSLRFHAVRQSLDREVRLDPIDWRARRTHHGRGTARSHAGDLHPVSGEQTAVVEGKVNPSVLAGIVRLRPT